VEGIAELVRLGGLVALAASSSAIEPVAAEGVPAKAGEEVVQDFLTDAAAPPGGQFQALSAPLEIACPLELLGQAIERLEIADALVAEEVTDLLAVDGLQVARPLDITQRILERVQGLEAPDLLKGAVNPEGFVAAEPEALTEPARQELVEGRRELGS